MTAIANEQDEADANATVWSIFGSIHSAKGKTHTETMILECLNRSGKKYDVHEVLNLLATTGDIDKATGAVRDIAQLIIVGATRPTRLLALAVHRERASPYSDFLDSSGWAIHDLTVRQ